MKSDGEEDVGVDQKRQRPRLRGWSTAVDLKKEKSEPYPFEIWPIRGLLVLFLFCFVSSFIIIINSSNKI